MRIPREYLIAFGFLFVCQGSAGYERYMLQGNTTAAVLDALLSIIGTVMLARGLGMTS